jgi:nucleoside-diphosphate-sugar epimerase
MILVSGATSQIGIYCLPLLVEAGYAVQAISRHQQTPQPGVTWLRADLTDLSITPAAPTHLLHLAGIPLLPPLLETLPPTLTRVIAFSSTSRFTKEKSPDPAERQLAAQLAQAEQSVMEICARRHIAGTIFRPTLIYGCGRDQNIAFITRMIQRFGFFPLPGPGQGLRQPVHAQDLALACLQALHNPKTYGHSYNLSGGSTLSYRQMVSTVFAQLGKKPRIVNIPPSLFSTAVTMLKVLPPFRHVSVSMLKRIEQDLCFDHSAAHQDFGYSPRFFSV